MKFPSLFKNKETTITSTTTLTQQQPWQWPSCKHPKTLSFRASGDDHHNMFKTVNSVFFDPNINDVVLGVETDPESTSNTNWFTNSSSSDQESTSFTTESRDHDHPEYCFDGESLETVVRGARSDRLFFKPEDTSSILEIKAMKLGGDEKLINMENPFEESSVVLAMESEDPYGDFRRSMEEMVESHGLRDWECLEELLGWYLNVNKKRNHGFIVGAFVDLLVSLANANANNASSSCTDAAATSFSSAASSFSSSPLMSSFQGHNREIGQEDDQKMIMF